MLERDPVAGRMLLEQVEVEERGLAVALAQREAEGEEAEQPPVTYEPYDPMAHLAQMKRRGFLHRECMEMHYGTLFGYTRELALAEEQERREMDKGRAGAGGAQVVEGTVSQVAALAPRAAPYAGDVVRYQG